MAKQDKTEPAPSVEPETKETKSAGNVEMGTIEMLAEKYSVPAWQMAGLKVAMNWGQGKELSDDEFLAARDAWLNGSVNRG